MCKIGQRKTGPTLKEQKKKPNKPRNKSKRIALINPKLNHRFNPDATLTNGSRPFNYMGTVNSELN